jgi:hypothetical protein
MTQITCSLVVVGCLTLASTASASPPERSRAAVLATLRQALPSVLACGPSIDDTVTARFSVSPEGAVRRVKVLGPHAKTPVGKCMKKELAALKFTPAGKSTPVSYPFRFGASAAAQAPNTGKLARRDLDGLLDVLEGDLKKCGEGEVRASFTVKTDGRPDRVEVADAADEKTQDCVTKRIARVRFPTALKPTNVSRTFALADGEG